MAVSKHNKYYYCFVLDVVLTSANQINVSATWWLLGDKPHKINYVGDYTWL